MSLKNWTAKERPGQWPLPGVRVVLEPLDWAEHGEGLYTAIAAPDMDDTWDYMPIGPFQSFKAFKKTISFVCETKGVGDDCHPPRQGWNSARHGGIYAYSGKAWQR